MDVNSIRINNELQFCPIGNLTPHRIWLWSTEDDLSFEEVARIGLIAETINQHYLTLEEAAAIAVEEFNKIYSDEASKQCFETPIDIWPK